MIHNKISILKKYFDEYMIRYFWTSEKSKEIFQFNQFSSK